MSHHPAIREMSWCQSPTKRVESKLWLFGPLSEKRLELLKSHVIRIGPPPFHPEFCQCHFSLFQLIDGITPIKAFQILDYRTLLCDVFLAKVDRASMAHSLEVRLPFLDHHLVEAYGPFS